MVTLTSIESPTFQAFHGSSTSYDEPLSCRSLERALHDVSSIPSSSLAEERPQEAPKPNLTRRISVMVSDRSGSGEADRPRASSAYTASSAPHRLFRSAKPETPNTWKPRSPSIDVASSKTESVAESSSWQSPESNATTPSLISQDAMSGRSGVRSPSRSKATGREDKPSNEILDGSDVLQQISNLTSTEPSNEREVFVGGLRESEDAVHITEEELATYFSKFGVIESVSINRDDRTHRGRGFAFVKFYQESAALNAVVADASTHVIRGVTVSVQWSRGAKDGGGERPRRRNSGTSGTSTGSPSRGGNRSSPKMSNFSGSQKGGHRGGGSNCGTSCSHGYSPHRSRSQGHLHASASTIPYGYCGGHGTDHMNQPMVCVMVPAQRAAALGLPHHPTHSLPSCSPRNSSAGEISFVPLAQGNGHSGYPSHTRSHSHTPTSNNCHGGGYSSYGQSEHHVINITHHAHQKANHTYSGHAPVHIPPVHQGVSQRRGRAEPRAHTSTLSGGGNAYTDYERSQYELVHPPNNLYPSQDWSGDGSGTGGLRQCAMRSQSPPTLMRISQARSGGGAPRPMPAVHQPYDNHYSLYASAPSHVGAIDGFHAGVSATGRRHSGSSLMSGRQSTQQDGLAHSSFYFASDCGNEHVYDRDYGYAGPSRMP